MKFENFLSLCETFSVYDFRRHFQISEETYKDSVSWELWMSNLMFSLLLCAWLVIFFVWSHSTLAKWLSEKTHRNQKVVNSLSLFAWNREVSAKKISKRLRKTLKIAREESTACSRREKKNLKSSPSWVLEWG